MFINPFWFISDIKLRAFKSFGPDFVQFSIPSPHVIGLLGPNGAGKSNILDALCFASGCPASVLRVKVLRELVHQDAPTELCEVEFGISQALPGGGRPGSGLARHSIRAAFTNEGSREYKIDGKMKTAQQIFAFLHAHNLYLDSNSNVIRQAQVTNLAENHNSPTQVADIVAEASGLMRWMSEAAKAEEEMANTYKALKDIQMNIKKLEQALSLGEDRLKQVSRAQQLEVSIEDAAESLARQLHRHQRACHEGVKEAAARKDEIKGHTEVAVLCQLDQDQQTEQLSRQAMEGLRSEASRRTAAALAQEVATLEEQTRSLHDQVDASKRLEQQGQCCLEKLHMLRAEVQQLASHIEIQGLEVQQLQESVEEVREAPDAAAAALNHLQERSAVARFRVQEINEALLAQCQAQSQTQAALDQARQQAGRNESRLKAAIAAVEEAKAAMSRLAAETGLFGQKPGGAALDGLLAEASTWLDEAEARAGKAAMQFRVLNAAGGSSIFPATPQHSHSNGTRSGALLLHECFRFRHFDPANDRSCAPSVAAAAESLAGGSASSVYPPLQLQPPVQTLLKAMAAVGGSALGVLVCRSRSEAVSVLEDAQRASQGNNRGSAVLEGSLRIWPLDSIMSVDRTAQQRAAVQALRPGLKAWLPLDFLEPLQPAYSPALQRAFGHMLVAADEETASQLSAVHGLPCVTLDGTVSRPGSVAGGWSGGRASPSECLLAQKLEIERAAATQAAAVSEQNHWEAVVQQVQAADGQLRETLLVLDLAKGSLHEVTSGLRELEGSAVRLESASKQLNVDLDAANLEARQCELSAGAAAATSLQQQQADGMQADCISRLEHELKRTRERLHGQQLKHGEAVMSVEELESKLEELDCLLGPLAVDEGVEEVQEAAEDRGAQEGQKKGRSKSKAESKQPGKDARVPFPAQSSVKEQRFLSGAVSSGKQTDLDLVSSRLLQVKEQLAALQCNEERAKRDALEAKQKLHRLKQEQKATHQLMIELQESASKIFGRLKLCESSSEQAAAAAKKLVTKFPHLCAPREEEDLVVPVILASGDTKMTADEDGPKVFATDVYNASSMGIVKGEKEIQQLLLLLEGLQAQQKKMHVVEVPVAEHVLQRERSDTLSQLMKRSTDLREAVKSLESGLSVAKQQVLESNEHVFGKVAEKFKQLCSILLPSMTITLAKLHECASRGLAVRVSRNLGQGASSLPSAPAPGSPSRGGVIAACSDAAGGSLAQLSGGQRTLVSLALLVAAAQEGSHSSVLLLDEVDAALDEHNQRSVARLLHDLSHSGGAQVICVSHNQAFQQVCDSLVHISRSASGESAAAAAQQQQSWPSKALGACTGTAQQPVKDISKKGSLGCRPTTKQRRRP